MRAPPRAPETVLIVRVKAEAKYCNVINDLETKSGRMMNI